MCLLKLMTIVATAAALGGCALRADHEALEDHVDTLETRVARLDSILKSDVSLNTTLRRDNPRWEYADGQIGAHLK